jgi:hypothetical protein
VVEAADTVVVEIVAAVAATVEIAAVAVDTVVAAEVVTKQLDHFERLYSARTSVRADFSFLIVPTFLVTAGAFLAKKSDHLRLS